MVKIIGIAGVTGAGKTTLVDALGRLVRATTVHWDEYDDISTHPADYVEWYRTSRDYAAWDYPALADTLRALKAGQSMVCPATKRLLAPTNWVVFDAPLGRLHVQTGSYIDFLVWLDLPPDISLARWILRDYRGKAGATASEVLDELEFYLSESRPLFVNNAEKIAGADLVLDATQPIEGLAKLVLGAVKS